MANGSIFDWAPGLASGMSGVASAAGSIPGMLGGIGGAISSLPGVSSSPGFSLPGGPGAVLSNPLDPLGIFGANGLGALGDQNNYIDPHNGGYFGGDITNAGSLTQPRAVNTWKPGDPVSQVPADQQGSMFSDQFSNQYNQGKNVAPLDTRTFNGMMPHTFNALAPPTGPHGTALGTYGGGWGTGGPNGRQWETSVNNGTTWGADPNHDPSKQTGWAAPQQPGGSISTRKY